MLPLLLLLLVALAAAGYGLLLWRVCGLDAESRLELATLVLTLGSGALALLQTILGFAGGLGGLSAWLVVGIGAAAGLFFFRNTRVPAATPGAGPGWLRIALVAAIALCVLANLIGALAPPSFSDALEYHLFVPREYLRAGAIVEIPEIWQSYQPRSIEMLYSLGLAIGGPKLAALLHAGLGVLVAASAGLLGRRLAGPLGGLLAAAVFYTPALVAWESTSCFVELGVTAFGTAGIHAMLRWDSTRRLGWLVCAGVLGGFAAGSKLTGAWFPILSSVAAIYLCLSGNRSWRSIVTAVGVLACLGIAGALPWYGISYRWTGNPIYPFLPSLFGDNPEIGAIWNTLGTYNVGSGILGIFEAPWGILSGASPGSRGQYLSILPVMLAPVILWRARKVGVAQLLALLGACSYLAWYLGAHVERYLLPIQGIAAALVAGSIVYLSERKGALRAAAWLAAAPALAFGVASTTFYDAQFFRVVLGLQDREAFLTRTTGHYPILAAAVRAIPSGGRVLTDLRPTFYLDRWHKRVIEREFDKGAAHLRALLERERATHLLIFDARRQEIVRGLGGRVVPVWKRAWTRPASRSLGGGSRETAALFAIRRPGKSGGQP